MTQEEKAKAYDEALERAKKAIKYPDKPCFARVDEIFPELKKSEDGKNKRISKEITQFLKQNNGWNREWLAWLERQGEQKPFDYENTTIVRKDFAPKIEPKFKIGDWVIDKQGIPHQIANVVQNVTNHTYGYDTVDGGYFNDCVESVRLWTIQDAKDGDVLATEDKNFVTPFVAIYKSLDDTIYNGLRDNTTFNSRCFIGFNGNFYIGEEGHAIEDIHPATKEQRDILFQKMKESGYEWDAEKKELKKAEQKTAWSEEDKRKLNRIYSILREAADTHAFSTSCRLIGDKECVELQDFLKSIVLQNTWKHSDEQMYKKVETAIDSYYAPFSRDAEEQSTTSEHLEAE